MMTVQDKLFMQIALEEAGLAYEKGEVPVGAVLVSDRKNIISRRHNLRESKMDSTAHAEILVIKESSRLLKRWRLSNTTLYVTLEPCLMCVGALIHARIDRLVFGCFDPKAGSCGSLFNIPEDRRFNHHFQVEQGCLENECSQILKSFFSELRESKKERPVYTKDLMSN